MLSESAPIMSGNACSTTLAPSTTSESTSRNRPVVASTKSNTSSSFAASHTALPSRHLSISNRIWICKRRETKLKKGGQRDCVETLPRDKRRADSRVTYLKILNPFHNYYGCKCTIGRS